MEFAYFPMAWEHQIPWTRALTSNSSTYIIMEFHKQYFYKQKHLTITKITTMTNTVPITKRESVRAFGHPA